MMKIEMFGRVFAYNFPDFHEKLEFCQFFQRSGTKKLQVIFGIHSNYQLEI